ncbi:MAG: hypothetical protein ACI9TH_002061 [Kiritimatiellia bacterium]|jgi:uncharacterized protein YbgA (DUF1722 family)
MSLEEDLRAENESLRNQLKEMHLVQSQYNALMHKQTRLQEELKKLEAQALNGLIQICASCKKIHEDPDQWVQIEEFIHQHGDVSFTHGFCPDCHKKMLDQ